MEKTVQETFNAFLEKDLNKQQCEAVKTSSGGLLVVAGAGSGKTRVITSRIAHLIINEGVEPSAIVGLTFTNKAAGEMKERLAHMFAGHYTLPFVGTFHGYCLLLLRTNSQFLEFKTFSILDGDDQVDLIKRILKKYGLTKQLVASSVISQISRYKNKAHALAVFDEQWSHPMVKDIFLEYESEKTRSHCLDFDDIIIHVLRLFKSNATFKKQFQQKVQHVLVDEYQDTNHIQHELLRSMALDDKNKLVLSSICAVGDEDQSIYSWRGATVANILKFTEDFAPVRMIKIEQNYRSVKQILDIANAVISNNTQRNPKNLWSDLAGKNRVLHVTCSSGDREAQAVALFVKTALEKKKHSDIALLYRTHFQSRTLEEALIHNAIPYRIIGGIRFYERKEIKDLLAYLKLVVNPYDKISLLRIINTPARGLGDKFEEQLLQAWLKNPLSDFKEVLRVLASAEDGDLTKGKKETVEKIITFFEGLALDAPPSFLIDCIITGTGYMSYLSKSYDDREAESKIQNVQEFVQAIIVFEKKYQEQKTHETGTLDGRPVASSVLEAFLQEVALLQESVVDNENHDAVQLMTLHAAKGLEFDTVILSGLEEGILPSAQSMYSHEALEEERRLLYVGITRARQYLVLFHAHSRIVWGQISDQVPSRFLDEIPSKLINTIQCPYNLPPSLASTFREWITGKKDKEFSFNESTFAFPSSDPFAKSVSKKIVAPKPVSDAVKPALSSWAKNQSVFHKTFGLGIIADVQRAPDNEFYLTVLFSTGKKKILSRFIEKHR